MTLPGCLTLFPIFSLLIVILGFCAGNSFVVSIGMFFLALCVVTMFGVFIGLKMEEYEKK